MTPIKPELILKKKSHASLSVMASTKSEIQIYKSRFINYNIL